MGMYFINEIRTTFEWEHHQPSEILVSFGIFMGMMGVGESPWK